MAEEKKYQNNYPGVIHHMLDAQAAGILTSYQFWYAMDKLKEIIKEDSKQRVSEGGE